MKDFNLQRELRVRKLSQKLHEALVLPRSAFSKIIEAANEPDACYNDRDSAKAGSSRFWTARVVSDALKLLVETHQLEVPQLPGFTWHGWFKDQTRLIHDLAKRANRNSSYKAMDADPTLQYQAEDWSSWAS